MVKTDPAIPNNFLPKLPPKFDFETKQILRKVVSARAALAEMKGTGAIIPNLAMLINTLTLREAKDSSEIENIVTTQDELYIAFATQQKNIDPQIKEVLNYREALWYGYNLIRKREILTINDITSIQQIIIGNTAGIRTQPGTQLKNWATGEVIYTPPEGEDVILKLLKNFEDYINMDDNGIDPLIKMALIHYQFESIHPYYDGNGRTGRIINILYLVMKRLLDIPILYLSSYIIKEKGEYYRLLSEIRDNDNWEEWIYYILHGIEETAHRTTILIKNIKELLEGTIEKVKTELPSVYSRDLVETIFEQPYCRVASIVDKGLYERRTAMKYLRALERIGVLKAIPRGNQILFLNISLYDLLKHDSDKQRLDPRTVFE
jgi:Fic family protein